MSTLGKISTLYFGAGARPRLPLLLCGSLLLWTVAGYSEFGATGLLVLAAVSVLAAVLLPRPLPSTLRAAVWMALLAAILSLSANLDWILPPQPGQDRNLVGGFDAYAYDRTATVAFALGLASLFFQPARATVTVTGVGCFPMMMMAMERARENEGWAVEPYYAWIGMGLFALAAQAQWFTRPRPVGVLPSHRSEWLARVGLPLLLLALAVPAVPRFASGARTGRDWLYERAGYRSHRRSDTRRSGNLSLHSPSAGFAGRMSPVLDIRASRLPGYLREETYHSYGVRSWVNRLPARESLYRVTGPDGEASEEGWQAFAVGENAEDTGSGDAWEFRLLRPRRFEGLCLPGEARTLVLPEGVEPQITQDGVVSFRDGVPAPAYRAYNSAQFPRETAYPWPDPRDRTEYLEIPARLEAAVSNWVARCDGLAESVGFDAAARSVVAHFHGLYEYRLGKPRSQGDPLEEFMGDREGHCTLFASAAALMLRYRGFPARVVAGYFCAERHDFTGRWVARERDAHAWCEVWDEASGRWRLVEATPPDGRPDVLPRPSRVRLLWEAVADVWRRLVDRLQQSNPLIALAVFIAQVFDMAQQSLASPAGALVLVSSGTLLGALWWRRRSRRKGRSAEEQIKADLIREMRRIERRFVSASLRRRHDEPWVLWQARIEGELAPEKAQALREILEDYQNLRYASRLDADHARQWLAAVRARSARRT